MKTRRRLGVLAIAVSGLLTAGLLFSAPAFAWSAHLKDVSASCPEGSEQPRVDFTLKFDTVRSGHIAVAVKIGEDIQKVNEVFNEADEADNTFKDVDHASFHFFLENPSEDTTITVIVATFFDHSEEKSVDKKDVDVKKCKVEETTTTTETTETTATTAPPASTEAPSSSIGETSTTESGGALPFTGSNTLPMLIAALVMVIGGLAAVYAGRIRGRHAK